MTTHLVPVSTTNQITDNVTTFNQLAGSNAVRLRSLLAQTTYWVSLIPTGIFGPSKFVGFRDMDFDKYEVASGGAFTGSGFNGAVTREAIEETLGSAYSPDSELSSRLLSWGRTVAGSDVFDGVDQSKWRFLELSVSSPEISEGIGELTGYPFGTAFKDRVQLSQARVHRPRQAGICGTGETGAESIVLSGGYEDDVDEWDRIIYTGQGGNDPDTKSQIADQELTRGNLALVTSCLEELPVRVIRGSREPSHHAPDSGYRYDGLYQVVRYWSQVGISGRRVWRYEMIRDDVPAVLPDLPGEEGRPVERRRFTGTTQVRNAGAARAIKRIYRSNCQICGESVTTETGPYAEAAHVRPLGSPHDGPDSVSNILCLCPNHHKQLDLGGLLIDDDLVARNRSTGEIIATLTLDPSHPLNPIHLAYHRNLWP
jgi:putative restriction endonuclease